MTQTKKGSSAKRKPSSKKKGTSASAKTVSKNESGIKQDIIFLAVIAALILLFISNFGIGGLLGKAVSNFFFGLFGLPEYVFSIIVLVAVIWALKVKKDRGVVPVINLIGLGGIFLFGCAFFQLLMVGYEKDARIVDFYLDSAYDHLGGGFFGGLLVKLFGGMLGIFGAYLIVIIGIMIFAILMTQKPLVTRAREKGSRVYNHVKEKQTASADLRRERRAEREHGSAGKNSFSEKENRLKKQKRSEQMHEILPEEKSADALVDEIASGFLSDESKTVVPVSGKPDFIDPFADDDEEEIPASFMEVENSADEERASVEKTSSKKNPRSSEKEIQQGISDVQKEISNGTASATAPAAYKPPRMTLLKKGGSAKGESKAALRETAQKLEQTLRNFGVNVTVTNVSCGPTVTRYELTPEQGVKVSRIVNLSDDIKLNLAAADIRIEAPIPGKAAVGIEVPNKTNASVMLRDILETEEFKSHSSKIAFAVGMDIAGRPVVADIAKMPHLLIAGATGSGKSVCINTMIVSILYKSSPDDVKLIMIDPKVVELSVYNGIPHLLIPVVTDPKKAAGALNWAVAEMTDRYNKFAEYGVRDLKGYNARIDQLSVPAEERPAKMPQIVVVVDELADLMMVAPGEVEDAICRLAQLARAAGIHLIIATQRPSVNVITGLIKANMPSRIALAVTSGVDSRTILDMNGAEKLLGHGDMLFYPQGYSKPARVQGAYVSDDEIANIVEDLKNHNEQKDYDSSVENIINSGGGKISGSIAASDSRDEYFVDAAKFIIEKDKASIGMLQRAFKIGFNRAARIMDQLAEAGVVGAEEGTKPRKVLMSAEQFENFLEEGL